MRIITIISDGVPITVHDDTKKSLEEATNLVKDLMENEKIMTVIGENSSAVVRPSSISAINIVDTPDIEKACGEPERNQEQKTEHVDMITDIDEGEK